MGDFDFSASLTAVAHKHNYGKSAATDHRTYVVYDKQILQALHLENTKEYMEAERILNEITSSTADAVPIIAPLAPEDFKTHLEKLQEEMNVPGLVEDTERHRATEQRHIMALLEKVEAMPMPESLPAERK